MPACSWVVSVVSLIVSLLRVPRCSYLQSYYHMW
jgi:hypothetical protein